jgi:hypothetical protein
MRVVAGLVVLNGLLAGPSYAQEDEKELKARMARMLVDTHRVLNNVDVDEVQSFIYSIDRVSREIIKSDWPGANREFKTALSRCARQRAINERAAQRFFEADLNRSFGEQGPSLKALFLVYSRYRGREDWIDRIETLRKKLRDQIFEDADPKVHERNLKLWLGWGEHQAALMAFKGDAAAIRTLAIEVREQLRRDLIDDEPGWLVHSRQRFAWLEESPELYIQYAGVVEAVGPEYLRLPFYR